MKLKVKKYTILDVLTIAFNCSPLHSILITLNLIFFGIAPTLQVYATAQFIDTATTVAKQHLPISMVYPSIAWLVILIGFTWLSASINKLSTIKLTLDLKQKFRSAVTDKRSILKYRHIECSDTWDLICRISNNPENTLSDAFINILGIASLFARIIGLVVILLTEAWWAALIIIAISIPLFYLSTKSGKANYRANREVTKYNRRCDYLTQIMTDRETVSERTLFGFSKTINNRWQEKYSKAQKIEISTSIKWLIRMRYGSLITTVISVFIIVILISPLTNGIITLGMFIALANATFSLVELMSWQLSTSFEQLTKHKELMHDLTCFTALEEDSDIGAHPTSPPPIFKSLEFKNVSFKYPNTSSLILDNLSFRIDSGKHYAFVGINGAGKTTITKLMTGLYDCYDGDILINGKSIENYSKSQLKSFYSVVYQDFSKYNITLQENITLGDPHRVNNVNTKQIIKDIELEDIVSSLPQDANTPLGKILPSSVDISTGGWQKVAMARAVINPAPFRILDEPTAALDPLSESKLYERFEQISHDKTTLFISHRLGSTKLADIIFVLDNGRLVESGSHNELMDKKSVYFHMFDAQRSWYQ